MFAEFISLGQSLKIWDDIQSGVFDIYLENYQLKKLYYEEHIEFDPNFKDFGDYGPQ